MASKVNNYFMVRVPAYGGGLREGVVGLPRTVNPVLALTDVDRDFSTLVYSGLTSYSNGKIVPDIAKSWTISPDGLTYTFNLRNDVLFQDGTRLTADDVAFTIQKIQDQALKSPRRSDWTNVTVNIPSPLQIQFTLKQPYAPFLANTTIGILPKHIWGTVDDDQFVFSQYNIDPIGSGPYRVSSIVRNSGGIPTQYHLATWSDYYGNEPYVETLTFDFYPDEDKVLSALDSGSIDSAAAISPDEAARLASDAAQPYRVLSAPLPRVFGVFFNQTQAPVLADKTVRQALNMSIDRAAIVKSVLNGYGLTLDGPLPAELTSDGTDQSNTAMSTSTIAAAQALLEKAGWKKDSDGIYEKKGKTASQNQILSFNIYTADAPDLKQAAEMVKDSWNKMGAQVGVKIFESSDLYQNIIRPRKYDALLFGELIGKDRDVYAFWHSTQRASPGLNVALYANSKVDKLLEDIRTSTDAKAQAARYDQVEALIQADVPAAFLYQPDFLYAIPKSLGGISLTSITVSSDRWNSVTSWYTEMENVWKVFQRKN